MSYKCEFSNKEELDHIFKMATLGEMCAGIAHDLNIPLTGVKSFLDLAFKGLEKEDFKKVRNNLLNLNTSAEYMHDLVQRILEYSRGTPDSVVEDINIEEIIKLVADLAHVYLARKQIELITFTTPDIPKIKGNKAKLMQILFNLIINAFNAIKHNHGQIELRADFNNSEIRIQVSDNGPGISDEDKEKVFKSFYTTKGKKNLGLGLSIGLNLVKEMKGTLTLDSKQGQGTTFFVNIPLN